MKIYNKINERTIERTSKKLTVFLCVCVCPQQTVAPLCIASVAILFVFDQFTNTLYEFRLIAKYFWAELQKIL